MPDLSKIPAGARERLARLAGDVPEWGVSNVDARVLAESANPEADLDIGPLGSSQPVPPLSPPSPQDEESSRSPEELDDDDFDVEGLAADDTPLDLGSGGSLIESAGSASEPAIADDPPEVPNRQLSAASVVPQLSDESSHSSDTPLPAPSVGSAPSSTNPTWNDDVPLPEEPDFYADEPSYFDEPYPDAQPSRGETRAAPNSSPIGGFPEPAIANLSASADEVRMQAEAHLVKLVGRADAKLREDQWLAIKALVMDHSRALVVQRTGWGKSAVYFVATALLRAQGHGPTVIISPLLALMRDQISAAERAGIRAVTINSANVTQWDEIQGQIRSGEVDVLLCSPERLNCHGWRMMQASWWLMRHTAFRTGDTTSAPTTVAFARCLRNYVREFRCLRQPPRPTSVCRWILPNSCPPRVAHSQMSRYCEAGLTANPCILP
jgi:ATP-dependent DNA helicase RecQ